MCVLGMAIGRRAEDDDHLAKRVCANSWRAGYGDWRAMCGNNQAVRVLAISWRVGKVTGWEWPSVGCASVTINLSARNSVVNWLGECFDPLACIIRLSIGWLANDWSARI